MSVVYSNEQVGVWLEANLPTWRLENGYLTRSYLTRSWRLTLMLANTIGFLAEAAWHHPEMLLSYRQLVVRLRTHDVGGITDKDFELARRIEKVAVWQPEAGDALGGAPKAWID